MKGLFATSKDIKVTRPFIDNSCQSVNNNNLMNLINSMGMT